MKSMIKLTMNKVWNYIPCETQHINSYKRNANFYLLPIYHNSNDCQTQYKWTNACYFPSEILVHLITQCHFQSIIWGLQLFIFSFRFLKIVNHPGDLIIQIMNSPFIRRTSTAFRMVVIIQPLKITTICFLKLRNKCIIIPKNYYLKNKTQN